MSECSSIFVLNMQRMLKRKRDASHWWPRSMIRSLRNRRKRTGASLADLAASRIATGCLAEHQPQRKRSSWRNPAVPSDPAPQLPASRLYAGADQRRQEPCQVTGLLSPRRHPWPYAKRRPEGEFARLEPAVRLRNIPPANPMKRAPNGRVHLRVACRKRDKGRLSGRPGQ